MDQDKGMKSCSVLITKIPLEEVASDYDLDNSLMSIKSGFTASDDNDDVTERRSRRHHRLDVTSAQPPAQNLLSGQQLVEHYDNCIRLAAENKITAHNAFGLHLIDYMEEVLMRNQRDNFQVASSSLDASAKIYAGRVDAVHQDTYKVLSGLCRSGSTAPGAAVVLPASLEDDEDGSGEEGSPAKLRRERSNTKKQRLVQQLNKIRLRGTALRMETDPIFQHQAISYDEGGTGELRLNNVDVLNDSCELLIDSNTQLMSCLFQETPTTLTSGLHLHSNFLRVMQTMSLSTDVGLCAQYGDFIFHANNPASSMPIPPSFLTPPNSQETEKNYPASICSNTIVTADISQDHRDISVEVPADDSLGSPPHTSQDLPSSNPSQFVESVKSFLKKNMDEFGTVNDDMLALWSGLKDLAIKRKRPLVVPPDKGKEKCSKSRASGLGKNSKVQFQSEIDQVSIRINGVTRVIKEDWGDIFKRRSVKTYMSKEMSEKMSYELHLLPQVNDDQMRHAYKSMCCFMTRQTLIGAGAALDTSESECSDGIPRTSSSDNSDPPDFSCAPAINGAHNVDLDDDEDNCNMALRVDPFFNLQEAERFDVTEDQLDLLTHPPKVNQVSISYALVYKRIDIRRVKKVMWRLLSPPWDTTFLQDGSLNTSLNSTHSNSTANSQLPSTSAQAELSSLPVFSAETTADGEKEHKLFSHLLQELKPLSSVDSSQDLNPAILLNCLLSLANDKNLHLENTEDLLDIRVSQDVPDRQYKTLLYFSQSASRLHTNNKRKKKPSLGISIHNKQPAKRCRTALDDWLDDSQSSGSRSNPLSDEEL